MLALLLDVDMPVAFQTVSSVAACLTHMPTTLLQLSNYAGMLALLQDVDMPVALKTMAASGAAASFRIFLMPVDAMKTIMQASCPLSNLARPCHARSTCTCLQLSQWCSVAVPAR